MITMGGADRAVHVQHDDLQPPAIMEPVDPLPVQIGQSFAILRQGQRLGLEPPHLRGRGRLCIDSTHAHNLAHDGIKGEPVSIVDIFVSRQPPIDRLPDSPSSRWTVFFPRRLSHSAEEARPDNPSASSNSRITKRPPSELSCAPKLQPNPAVEIHPITPLGTRTL